MGSERAQREADHALFDSAHVVQLAVKFLMNLLCYFWIVFSVIQISDRNDGCFQIMGLQSSRYKEQMYNYWIIIWEDGKRFPPPRITRLKGKIRWDDDRTQYFSFPNIEQFVPSNTISFIEVILFADSPDKDVNIIMKTSSPYFKYPSPAEHSSDIDLGV